MTSRIRLLSLLILLIIFMLLSAFWGRYPAPGFTGFQTVSNNPMALRLILQLRLPRILTAVLAGAVLAGSGALLQTVLGNPLVEPGLLGVSQGSAFGAALGILTAGKLSWSVPLSAVLFGLMGLALSWFLARHIRYGGIILRLVLAGVLSSALFSAGLGILKYLADPRGELQEITFWIMGSLSSISWPVLSRMAPPVLVCLILMLAARWRINLFSLDDRSAFALGSSPGRERILLVTVSVVAVALITAEAGIISWVGLLTPHMARRTEAADMSKVLPTAMLLGGLFVLFCDNLARSALTGEIPLGLLTALFGVVSFALLMARGNIEIRR